MNVTELPNPTTDLAFLPPRTAYEVQIGRYIMVGSLGAFVWDFLGNTVWDAKLLYDNRIRLPTICYFFSRICSLVYMIFGALYETAPLGNCRGWLTATSTLYGLSIGSTEFLFFLRLAALFMQNRYIVAFFFALWMVVVGLNLSIVNAVGAANIGPTQICLLHSVEEYAFLAAMISLIFDSLVYIAITVRLASQSSSNRDRARMVLFGESLPKFSKMFFKDSQLYFLVTVTCNAAVVAMAYTTNLSGTYRTLFTSVNVMVSNSMACSLFRRLRFNLDASTSSTPSGSGFNHRNNIGTPSIPLALQSNCSTAATGINPIAKLNNYREESFIPGCKFSEEV